MDLGIESSGTSIQIREGETLRIRLAENLTTGYLWEFKDKADEVLELAKDSFEPPADPRRIGAGGTRVLEFKTKIAGNGRLRLTYVRPGLPESVTQTYDLEVHVTRES